MAWRWLRGSRRNERHQATRVEPPPLNDSQAVAQLLSASRRGEVALVRELLDSGRVDVDCIVDVKGKAGTALHCAAQLGHVDVVRLLIERGADVRKPDKNADTPLHWAATWVRPEIAELLLRAGADVHATDNVDAKPMHCVLHHIFSLGCNKDSLMTLRVLVAYNATWDERCDRKADLKDVWTQVDEQAQLRWKLQAPAIRLCVLTWENDRSEGRRFTNIPVEEVAGGLERLHGFLRARAASANTLYRRKICVVGPSEWGKTSLTKSLTMEKPILEKQSNRTIGIDQFKMSFSHEIDVDGKAIVQNHEVTFWDYAGQGAYEAMHSVFFTRRTLFFVCVDIHAFKTAMAQANMMADNDSDVTRLLYQFVDRTVLRWVRMILARQPDAEFQFLCTKCDLLNECDEILDVVTTATTMLQMVMVVVREIKDQAENFLHEGREVESPVTYLGDPRLATKPKPHVDVIWTSCTRQEDVDEAKAAIQAAILNSAYSYEMPELYLRVLEHIVTMRTAASQSTADLRIEGTFVDAARLLRELQAAINPGGSPCRGIVEALHDLGDILWFRDIGDPELANTIVIDPTLLIDFIRQVFDHNYTGETMPHAKLMCLPFWKELRSDQRMLSMKHLMQHFHLVYPATGEEMHSASDLIVPAYWKSNISAIWVFGGDVLRPGRGFDESDVAVRVHWEIHFTNYLPDALFDHFVVASYSPFEDRQIGPDWILYQFEDVASCRVVTGRDRTTHNQTLHLEALVTKTATETATENLWATFRWLCVALSLVLSRNKGVSVTSFAHDGTPRNPSLLSLMRPTTKRLDWMPPEPTRTECLQLLTRERHGF